jgi:hypothetical protein
VVSQTIDCTTTNTKGGTTQSCTVNFTYETSAAAKAAPAIARASIAGRTRVIGRGQVHGRTVKLKLGNLRRGRYHVTLLRRASRHWVVIGHTTLVTH